MSGLRRGLRYDRASLDKKQKPKKQNEGASLDKKSPFDGNEGFGGTAMIPKINDLDTRKKYHDP